MEFVTVKDVELCSAGMEWPSAGGPVTLTLEHIADCVRAGEDTLITPARLKIGHSDPRFADPDDPGHDPFYDGEPAFGSIGNLRLTNDGATATGDYLYVPRWLADGLPAFYPSRSIEGAYSIQEGPGGKLEARWDVETPGGKHYSFVLTACALLGVQAPAVKDLEDLQFRLTEGEGVLVTGDPDAGGVPIAVSMGDVKQTMTLTQAPAAVVSLAGGSGPVTLEADVDKVIDVFYSEFCVDERYWWWARAVRVDPNVIVADDDEGSLWRVPIQTDADQNITFGEPERVIQTFQPAPEAKAVLAAAAQTAPSGGRTLKAFAAREQTVPSERKERPEGGGNGSGNTSGMDFSELSDPARKRLALAYGLSEDATDEQLEEAVAADPDESGEGNGEGGEGNGSGDGSGSGDGGEGSKDGGEGDGEGSGSGSGSGDGGEGGSAPAAAEGTTTPVDTTVLAQLKDDAAAGRAARDQQIAAHRESVLKAALGAGKITPASKDAWLAKLNAAPEATEAELDALPDGLVPVDEVGHGGGGDSATATTLGEGDMEAMFPGHSNRKATA